MNMRPIILTVKEEICLMEVLYNHKACSSGCILEEMEESKKNCDECAITESVWNILGKLESA